MRAPDELHVVVLAGGLTYEREVSLRSGHRVAAAMREVGAEVSVLDADADLLPALAAHRPDAVFVAVHGASGEDGSLQAVLELVGMPYVGSAAAACRVAWDKPTAKTLVRGAGLSTPDWVALPHATFRELGAQTVLDRIVERLGLPLMVKPAQGGSALGAHRVHAADDLPAAMVACFGYGDTVLVEPLVAGVEVAVSVVDGPDGPRALPAVEIVPPGGEFDFAARYTAGLTTYHTPARVDPVVALRAAELAERAHAVLGLRDLSRTDAVVTAAGEVQFLEVNVAPGMTETSLTPMAVQAAGLGLGSVCLGLVQRAVARG